MTTIFILITSTLAFGAATPVRKTDHTLIIALSIESLFLEKFEFDYGSIPGKSAANLRSAHFARELRSRIADR
jgi:hypothetical protein